MARRREPAQALPGTASRQVPTKHVPARLAPGGATPAETLYELYIPAIYEFLFPERLYVSEFFPPTTAPFN